MPARTSQGLPDLLDLNANLIGIRGTTGDDTLTDTSGPVADSLAIFTGKGGNDVFIGGAADQNLFRDGPGVDTFYGGSGFNRVSFGFYGGETSGAYANLTTGVIRDAYGNTEQMTNIQALGWGPGNDTLIGDDHANVLFGTTGDLLFGGGGDDAFLVDNAPALVDGGSGVNTLLMNGYSAIGTVPETHGTTVDLSKHMILDDGFGGSGVILNIQNVYGSPLGDVIIGDKSDNVLMGLAGDDTLTGGGGADIFLFNGEAADIDVNPTGNGHDLITDFRHGDRIAFDMPGVASLADLTIGADAKGDVVITYGSYGDTITLLHVHHVSAGDFIFGPV